ncbi:beta-galactosidase [Desmospora activa]|nr:beta-galactosidase [Desmospora activa]
MKQGQFIIDGKPRFLYGGEFHYFRCPREEWSQRLDLLLEAGCNLVSTYVPWAWHEPKEGEVDLTGKRRPETDLRAFLQLVADKGLYCIVRPGPYVMAEVKKEGIPQWVHQQYPEVIARTKNGELHPNQVVSYLHPLFLEKVERWYAHVCSLLAPFQRDRGGPVIMFQLCNEIGMLHWVSNTSDYHLHVLERFQRYLERQYGNLEGLNQAYGTDVKAWDTFVERFLSGEEQAVEGLHWEWGRFWRELIKEYVAQLKQMAENHGITVPYLINIHGFKDFSVYSRGTDYPIGLSQLYRTAEVDNTVLAGDFYPGHIGYDTYHDLVLSCALTQAISAPEQPLFSAEFQSGRLADRPRVYPQDLDLNARTCIAHGMNALNYYMFVGGENRDGIGLFGRRHEWQAPVDSEGRLRPSYQKASHIGKILQAAGEHLLPCRKRSVTHLAFYPDYYMTETIAEGAGTQQMAEAIAGERERYFFDGVGRLLTAANLPYEAVDVLREQQLEPQRIPTLWMFSGERMDQALQQKLVHYVHAGGKLVLFPRPPVKNLDGSACTVLIDELEIPSFTAVPGIGLTQVMEMDSVKVDFRLLFETAPGEPVAWDEESGKVTAYLQNHGKGSLLMLGLGLAHDYGYQLDVIRQLAKRIGVNPILTSDNPEWSLVERSDGKTSFCFIHNYDEIVHSGKVFREGQALFDGERLTVAPRSGVMLPLNLSLQAGVAIRYSTMELMKLERRESGWQFQWCLPASGEGIVAFVADRGWSVKGEINFREKDDGNIRAVRVKGRPDETVAMELYRETD